MYLSQENSLRSSGKCILYCAAITTIQYEYIPMIPESALKMCTFVLQNMIVYKLCWLYVQVPIWWIATLVKKK